MKLTPNGIHSLLVLLLMPMAACFTVPASAWDEGPFIKGKGTEETKDKEGGGDGLKPFDEIVKGCQRIDGLFPFYRNRDEGKLYMEIPKDHLDHPYICGLTREAAEGVFFDNGAMLDEFIVVLHREGKKVRLIRPNALFRAPGDSAFARAIDRGVSGSLLAVMEIASKPHPDSGSLLVDPTPFFLQDHGWVAFALKSTQAGYALDRDGSYIDTIDGFPLNTEVEVVLNFRSESPGVPMPILPDPRSFQHRYHWSFVERPPEGYRPRLADDRVGHFLTMLEDYSNTRAETPYVRYVNRWRLEKQDPNAPISPPKEPIVYWIENTVPPEYRDAVRRGILAWNRAFEAAGFREAIVVKQMPDTAHWNPADVRYHVVRWVLQPGRTYAVGPSRTDPLTGEIFDADVRVAADITRVVYREWSDEISPMTALHGLGNDRYRCDLAAGLVNEAAFGLGLAAVRGLFDPDSPEGRRYVNQYVESLVCHEVGHTLGLRHNFKSSTVNTLEELQDSVRTREVGVTGSIMDYAPVNLARVGESQGEYWQLLPGAYDLWAIEYAYLPIAADSPEGELPELERIASRASEPLLAYGTDEDARPYSATGIDPTVNWFDLSSDPIEWCSTRMDLADEIWSRMDAYLTKPGQRYPRYRVMFQRALYAYTTTAYTVPKYVGGIYHRRDHVGDPGGRVPFEPVPAATQRRALALLADRLFSERSFQIPATMINKLAPERFPNFEGTIFSSARIDLPVHGMILRIQSAPLDRLYDPVTLSRIQDAEMHFVPPEKPFTMIEMFTTLRGAIWSELGNGRGVTSMRRNLQRAHLNRLIQLAVAPGDGTPEDATTCARADLKSILRSCERVLTRPGLDPMTRAHLDETKDRITAALAAPVSRPLPKPEAGPQM